MSECNFVDNNGLVELIERGLRKGYWDKALIPELKKRFKELEKQEQLLGLYKELATVRDDMLDVCKIVDDDYYVIRETETNLEKRIKELENDTSTL